MGMSGARRSITTITLPRKRLMNAGGEDFGYFATREKRVRVPPVMARTVEAAPQGRRVAGSGIREDACVAITESRNRRSPARPSPMQQMHGRAVVKMPVTSVRAPRISAEVARFDTRQPTRL